MPTFSYIAVNNQNNPVNGSIEQPDRTSAIDALVKQGLRPVSIKEIKTNAVKNTKRSTSTASKNQRVKNDQLVIFTRQLAAMVGAGVPLLRALTSLCEHITESPVLQQILTGVISDVEAGSTLGDALAKYPATFSDVYVNMVRAGEAAGILEEILNRLALQQEKSSAMRKKIKSSMNYPIVLITITSLAFFGLMFFIIPQIEKVITDLGGPDAKLPALTVFMLDLSHFIADYWYLIIGGSVALVFSFLKFIKTTKGRYWFHGVLLKTPVIKKLIMKIAVANFARTFSALTQAGVAVIEALHVTARAVGNARFEEALLQAAEEVKNGKSLSSVIEKKLIFPPIVPQMLLVGEETGQTDRVLVKVADFYEEEVDLSIAGLGSIIEPIMILIMGGMVGLIAASVMLPIANLAENIKA
ncbi:MAG: type II secretion system F family protein [Candidatus Saccharimonadaceae bacterium]|nr:type II secretion system F family protein [Candidatus Saccharimonadaceae bacterium]